MRRAEVTSERWDEAYEEIVGSKLLDDNLDEPTDEEVWELLTEWAESDYDDYADSKYEQSKDERMCL